MLDTTASAVFTYHCGSEPHQSTSRVFFGRNHLLVCCTESCSSQPAHLNPGAGGDSTMGLFILLMLWPAVRCAPFEGPQTYFPSGGLIGDNSQTFHNGANLHQMIQEPEDISIHHGALQNGHPTHHASSYSSSYSSHGHYRHKQPAESNVDSSFPLSSLDLGTSTQGADTEGQLQQVQLNSPHSHHHHNQYFYQHSHLAPGPALTNQDTAFQQSYGGISSPNLETERQPEQLLLDAPSNSGISNQEIETEGQVVHGVEEEHAPKQSSSQWLGIGRQQEHANEHAFQHQNEEELSPQQLKPEEQLEESPRHELDHHSAHSHVMSHNGQTHHVIHRSRLPLQKENQVHGTTITKATHKVSNSQEHGLHHTLHHATATSDFPKTSQDNPLHPSIQKALDNIMKDLEEHPGKEQHPPTPTHHHKTVHHITHIRHVTKHAQPTHTVTNHIHGTAKDDINLAKLIEELHQLEQSPSHHNVTWCEEKIKEFLQTLRRKQLQGVTIDQKVTEETLHNILNQDQTVEKTVHTSVNENGGIIEEPFIRKTFKELGHNEPTKSPTYWLETEMEYNRTHRTHQNHSPQNERNPDSELEISSAFEEQKHKMTPEKAVHNADIVSSQETEILKESTKAPEVFTGVPVQDHVPELTILSHMRAETPDQEKNNEETEEDTVDPQPPPFVTNNNVPTGLEANQGELDTKLPELLTDSAKPSEQNQDIEEFQSSTEQGEDQLRETEISSQKAKNDGKSSAQGTSETDNLIQAVSLASELNNTQEDTNTEQHNAHNHLQTESQDQINSDSHSSGSLDQGAIHRDSLESLETGKPNSSEKPNPTAKVFDIEAILNNESTNQTNTDSISIPEDDVTSQPHPALEYNEEWVKSKDSEKMPVKQSEQSGEEGFTGHIQDGQEFIAGFGDGDQELVSQEADSSDAEGGRRSGTYHSSSEYSVHHTGTYHHGQNQNPANTPEAVGQSEGSPNFPTLHDLHTQQINYETLIEELVQLESLPGHQAIDKCEEKIREFLEVLRLQQERGFGRNQQELEKLHKTLIEQAESRSHELTEQQPSSSSPSFWSRVGKKIKRTYQKAKQKAQTAIHNVLE